MAWATKALDEVRREVWNDARHRGEHAHARQLKRTRYAVWRNQENLTERQQRKLAWLEQVNRPLFRAYLLKENLRLVFQLPFDLAVELLRMSPARVSEMPPRRSSTGALGTREAGHRGPAWVTRQTWSALRRDGIGGRAPARGTA